YRASYAGQRVALKRIRTFTSETTKKNTRLQFCQEALLWQGLRHRSILPFLGIDRETFTSSYCMVSPWMKHGTVIKYLDDHGRSQLHRLLLEICLGLEYLHTMKIVHGDLRGNNILVSDDCHACLTDFGLASSIQEQDTVGALTSGSNRGGSARWLAPELILPTQFNCQEFIRTPATDVYAFACVCIEMETGAPPFPKLPDVGAMVKVVAGERPQQPSTMSDKLWTIVSLAWAADFKHRPEVHSLIRALESLSQST
ncbi:kinase-like domain-containing protein, partial [Mycena alexandri]